MDLCFWLFEISMALLRFLVWMFMLLVRCVLPFGWIILTIGSDQFCAFVDDVSLICNSSATPVSQQSVLQDGQLRLAAVVGLGYAYAGSCREESCWSIYSLSFRWRILPRYKLNTHENSLSGSCLVFNFEIITSSLACWGVRFHWATAFWIILKWWQQCSGVGEWPEVLITYNFGSMIRYPCGVRYACHLRKYQ